MSEKKLLQIEPEQLIHEIISSASPDSSLVFDCDGTLIRGDIASLSAWGLIRFGLANPDHLPAAWEEFKKLPLDYSMFRKLRNIIIEQRGMNGVYGWETLLHSGLPPSTSLDVARAVVEECLKNSSLHFEEPLCKIATGLHKQSWIVSGSPQICVCAIGERLAIPPERILGTRLETVDDIYSLKIMEPGVIWEELKRTVLHEQKIFSPYFVAGDSIGDWQMFEMATTWCWAAVWGEHRHRGDEFRNILQERILGADGPTLPVEAGFFVFQERGRKWVFEIKSGT